jgi:ribonuclease J
MNTDNNQNTNQQSSNRGFLNASTNINTVRTSPLQKITPNNRNSRPIGKSNSDRSRSFGKDARRFDRPNANAERKEAILDLEKGNIRIIPLGGVEEVGRNMTLFEIGDDILIVDMGFSFKDESTPGVDYLLPNTEYLEARKHKIRGVLITHGHLDHIGAIPYLMDKLGNPPMYCRFFTSLMIQKRQEEFPQLAPLNIKLVEKSDKIKLGNLNVKFFSVTHTIPDAMGIMIETEHGQIVHTGDLRLEHENGIPSPIEEEVYSVFKNEKVLLLLADSTNSENPGFSTSNSTVYENFHRIIKDAPGRLIASMFSSQAERIGKFMEIAEQYGKKIIVEGRSMKSITEILKAANMLTIRMDTLISIEEMYKYPENKLVILVTGSQGEEFGALMRIATRTHKYIACNVNDTILLSSSVIPGNERGVQKLKDSLSRQGVKIIHSKTSDVHASGHANRDEQAWIISQIKPKFFLPIHGYHYMCKVHADTAVSTGIPKENTITTDNGSIVEISADGETISKAKAKAPSGLIYVDGFSVGNMQDVVLRDRGILSSEGVFVTAIVIDSRTGKLRKSPDIVSRGFVYLKESQELLRQVRLLIRKKIEDTDRYNEESDEMRNDLNDTISKFFVKKTGKAPIVMSIIIFV